MKKLKLTPAEKELVDTLKSTSLGKEGQVLMGLLSKEGVDVANKLVEKGVCKIENGLNGSPTIRLNGVDYPKTLKELVELRKNKYK